MPDIHWGYGFCIGGVCATDPDEGGVISLAAWATISTAASVWCAPTSSTAKSSRTCASWSDDLFRNVPTGVGRSGRYKFDKKELQHILDEGPRYLRGRGLATPSDIEYTEAEGRLDGADRRRSAITP